MSRNSTRRQFLQSAAMATYTGEKIGWEQAAQSQELLGPKEYAWGPIAMPAVAQPGITKFA
ncbi:MAG: hypothetical protein FJ295_07005 [Planctomycetes bacterium]|nr:hypothetical protein [Planctomycetota bacterium]